MVSLGDTAISLHILQPPPGGGGVLPKVGFGLGEENWSLEIGGGRGVFCQRSALDLGKKIGVWKFGGRGVLPKVGFGLREENWSLEIFFWGGVFCQMSDLDSGKKIGVWKFWGGGECSAKGRIWTRGRKLQFGNWGGGGVLPKVRFGLREENWSLEILGGGVFCQRSDLDSWKKIAVWKFGGGVLPKVGFGLGEGGVFCPRSDLDSGKKIGVWNFFGGALYQISE